MVCFGSAISLRCTIMAAGLASIREGRQTEMNQENVGYYKTPFGQEPFCTVCGSDVLWVDCENCEDGYSHHDCGEDTCCCLDPLPNVVCDWCDGKGGWYVCLHCDKTETRQK